MSNKIKVIPFIIENNLDRWDVIDHGFANGYVAIPPSHKYYGKRYDDIDIDVHCGLTYSQPYLMKDYLKSIEKPFSENNSEKLLSGKYTYLTLNNIIPYDWWVLGFDTFHCDDNKDTCDINYCISETLKLAEQLNK